MSLSLLCLLFLSYLVASSDEFDEFAEDDEAFEGFDVKDLPSGMGEDDFGEGDENVVNMDDDNEINR